MVRYATPGRFKQRLEEEKKREEERRREEQRKREELARRQYVPPTPVYYPTTYDRTSRRSWLKGIAMLAIAGAAAAVFGTIANYRPPTETPPPPVQQETEEQSTPQTQETITSEPTYTETITTKIIPDPDNWPMKSNLYDLKNAQFENSSFSQYVAPEYDSERYIYDSSANAYINTIPDQYWIKMTREELVRLWGSTRSDREINEMLAGNAEFAVYILRQGGSYYFRAPNRWRGSDGKYWWRFGDLYAEEILDMWEPNDPDDQVLFRNSSGSFRTIAKG